jgi:transglutaminase-like putative cysteine protease
MELVFSDKVRQHQFTLRMIPDTDKRQEITECIVNISPECKVCEDTDAFGNKYVYGEIEEYHESFNVDVSGTAVIDAECKNMASESEIVYRYQSLYTRPGNRIKAYYEEYKKGNSESDLDFALRLMHSLHNDIEYKKGVTGIETKAEQALEIKAGVCQDYSHIMISLLRLAGIPAKYVVGMMMGEGFSHAWVEACIDGAWTGFDPTNDNIVDDTYIKLSCGRDYQDCIVNRGVFYGCVTQNQNIKVTVSEV